MEADRRTKVWSNNSATKFNLTLAWENNQRYWYNHEVEVDHFSLTVHPEDFFGSNLQKLTIFSLLKVTYYTPFKHLDMVPWSLRSRPV